MIKKSKYFCDKELENDVGSARSIGDTRDHTGDLW